MLTIGPVDLSLYPKSPKSLKSQWVLYASQIADPIELIEIDNTFLLSLGAHDPHQYYLFAAKRKPTLNEICLIESAISFCFDCPCALIEPRFPKESMQLRKGYRKYYKKFHGPIVEGMFDPFRGQAEAIDIASQNALDTFKRRLDAITPGETRWKMKLPTRASVKNAMFVYRLAANALDPFTRILNYWRCLESLTTINERRILFADVPNLCPEPVLAIDVLGNNRRLDVMKKYVSESRLHFNHLVKTLGSASGHQRLLLPSTSLSRRPCPWDSTILRLRRVLRRIRT